MEHLVDAHCHYNPVAFSEYDGPCNFICNSTCETDWARIMAAAAATPNIHPAIGVHPWYWYHTRYGWEQRMRRLLIENPRLMIGEIGLDTARPHIQIQEKIFKIQYKMAVDFRRTVHIHCVHAWNLLMKIIAAYPLPPVIVIHRYSASMQLMEAFRRAVNDQVYFSYRDINNDRMRKTIMATPASRVLAETDGWTPDPERIMELVSQIAFVRGASTSKMADIIYNNSLQVINNGQIA